VYLDLKNSPVLFSWAFDDWIKRNQRRNNISTIELVQQYFWGLSNIFTKYFLIKKAIFEKRFASQIYDDNISRSNYFK